MDLVLEIADKLVFDKIYSYLLPVSAFSSTFELANATGESNAVQNVSVCLRSVLIF